MNLYNKLFHKSTRLNPIKHHSQVNSCSQVAHQSYKWLCVFKDDALNAKFPSVPQAWFTPLSLSQLKTQNPLYEPLKAACKQTLQAASTMRCHSAVKLAPHRFWQACLARFGADGSP